MSTPTLDAPTLRERLSDGAAAGPRLVDVRTPAEFEAGHIPGAVNVPLDVLKGQLDDVCRVLHGQDVVLVCRSGARSDQARQALSQAGHADSAVLSGGILDWEKHGGEVDRGRQVWDMERQVRFTAGSLVLTGVLTSVVLPKAKWLAGFVGGGLVFAALSNTCAMGNALGKMPWNRRGSGSEVSPLEQLAGGR